MTAVAITGMGVVSAAGLDLDTFTESLLSGRSAVGDFVLPRLANNRRRQAACIKHLNGTDRFSARDLASCDRFSVLALLAAAQALGACGLEPDLIASTRTAVVIGTGVGGATTIDDGHHALYVDQRRLDPLTIARLMPSAAAAQISARWGCRGTVFAVSSACASAAQAIGVGMGMIRTGQADRVIVGGSEASLTPAGFRSWEAMRVLTDTKCRPFSCNRDGMVLGEGAAIFVLEDRKAARARRAPIVANLLGYGTSSDAKDLVRPDPVGAALAIELALQDAALDRRFIGHVNAHGTGTRLNDTAEAAALTMVFGDHLGALPVSATKPIHGHALGAAGAIELVAAIVALQASVAPPTLNFTTADPDCRLRVSAERQTVELPIAMSNSFAFGGINASLIVAHPDWS
ncbi:beta-ketoacyl-[acyl-carrier-protein] synthase family protein [Boseaceae bacterium BT-24-1]|nr:beta-ketoacyl-[acyl-carrier-protein] synthase family protein [Boseaceae bacterium BT-24-1]